MVRAAANRLLAAFKIASALGSRIGSSGSITMGGCCSGRSIASPCCACCARAEIEPSKPRMTTTARNELIWPFTTFPPALRPLGGAPSTAVLGQFDTVREERHPFRHLDYRPAEARCLWDQGPITCGAGF